MSSVTVPVGVDWLTAVAGLLSAIVWPGVVLAIFIAFRRPIGNAIQHLIEFRFGGATMRFEHVRGQVSASLVTTLADQRAASGSSETPSSRPLLREYYAERIHENPLNAILEAYEAIEGWYDRTLAAHDIEVRDREKKLGVREMSRIAVEHGLLPSSTISQLDGLGIMRDLAIQQRDAVTPQRAQEFLVLVDAVLYTLDTELGKSDRTS